MKKMGFTWILFYKPIKCVAKNPLVLVYEANGTTQIHDQIWRFHNFMPLKIMKPSASFIFDAKIIRKEYRQFHKVFTWNCGTIKNKNKDGFCWNLIFYIKQANKSRFNTVISLATLYTIPKSFVQLTEITMALEI